MHIEEFIQLKNEKFLNGGELYTICPKGTFGSGKSSLPLGLLNTCEQSTFIYWPEEFGESTKGNLFPVALFIPEKRTVIVGKYHPVTHKCGGCDAWKQEKILQVLGKLWESQFNIFYEGVIISHTRTTYVHFHNEMMKKFPNRKRRGLWPFLYVHPLEAVRRIMSRGSKRSEVKGVKLLKVLEKYNTMIDWFPYYDKLDNNEAIWIDTHNGLKYTVEKILDFMGEL